MRGFFSLLEDHGPLTMAPSTLREHVSPEAEIALRACGVVRAAPRRARDRSRAVSSRSASARCSTPRAARARLRRRVPPRSAGVLLSTRDEATIEIESLVQGPGGRAIHFEYAMTRAELDVLAAPFVERTLAVCKSAFEKLKVPPKAFDRSSSLAARRAR